MPVLDHPVAVNQVFESSWQDTDGNIYPGKPEDYTYEAVRFEGPQGNEPVTIAAPILDAPVNAVNGANPVTGLPARDPRYVYDLGGHAFYYNQETGALAYPSTLTPPEIRLLLNQHPEHGIPQPWDLEDPTQIAYLKAVEEEYSGFGGFVSLANFARAAAAFGTAGLSELGGYVGAEVGTGLGGDVGQVLAGTVLGQPFVALTARGLSELPEGEDIGRGVGTLAGSLGASASGVSLFASPLPPDPPSPPGADLGSITDDGGGFFHGDDGGVSDLIGGAAKDTLDDGAGASLGDIASSIASGASQAVSSVGQAVSSAGASLGSFLPNSLSEGLTFVKTVLGLGVTAAGIVQAFTGDGPSPARTVAPGPVPTTIFRPATTSGGGGAGVYYVDAPAMGRGSLGTISGPEAPAADFSGAVLALAAAAGLAYAFSKS